MAILCWSEITKTTYYGFSGVYAVGCGRTGRWLVCATGTSIAKRIWDHVDLLRRHRHSNPLLQADYDAEPASLRFYFLERCSPLEVTGRKRHHLARAVRDGRPYNLARSPNDADVIRG
jgi:hypothetical protein